MAGQGDWLDEMSKQGDWLDGTVVTGRADVPGQRSWMWQDEGTQFWGSDGVKLDRGCLCGNYKGAGCTWTLNGGVGFGRREVISCSSQIFRVSVSLCSLRTGCSWFIFTRGPNH